MKLFKNDNQKTTCIICNNNHSGDMLLIPISESNKDNTYRALPVHIECLDLMLYPQYDKDNVSKFCIIGPLHIIDKKYFN